MNKPNFFIIGAPKCGTTSMYHWLKQHTQIFFPEIKETHFFSTDLNSKKRAVKDFKTYINLYQSASSDHLILGDASVFYLYSKVALENIIKFNRSSKFLVMYRNPVDMVISLHRQYLYTGNEIYKNIEKAWSLNDMRINGKGVTKITEDPQLLHYGKVCKLGEQVERLLKKVERKQIKFIFLEDLKNNPEKELLKLFNFLEINYEKLDLKIFNKASQRRFPKIHRSLKYLNLFKRSVRIGKLNTGFGNFYKKYNNLENKNKKISKEFRNELDEYFEKDQENLIRLIS